MARFILLIESNIGNINKTSVIYFCSFLEAKNSFSSTAIPLTEREDCWLPSKDQIE